MKKFLKLVLSRLFIGVFLMLLQLTFLIIIILQFDNYFIYFYTFSFIISMISLFIIVKGRTNPSYKISLIILILLFPIFGGLFYLIFGSKLSKRKRLKMLSISEDIKNNLTLNEKINKKIYKKSDIAFIHQNYIKNCANFPMYSNTYTKYLEDGTLWFERLKKELLRAKHYIFLEFFIIEEGIMWNSILDILVSKIKEGVEVRLIYDDLGCINSLSYKYHKKLESLGIKCTVFNPFIPILNSRINNRDHRKIVVIDGYIGFTGGINIADEYINIHHKCGYWKDTGIVLEGEAVWSLTVSFLSVWNFVKNSHDIYSYYKPEIHQEKHIRNDGFVQPYSDNPLDNETIGETVYFNMITKATKYLYITTPYLIIDNEILTALRIAAKSGIDVRIITPGIPDKWYVHMVTEAYYETLLKSGVKIYEYTPGFIHAKTFVSDDLFATVGTVNLDYRSLYLHFECGVLLYDTKSVCEIKNDFLGTVKVSKEVTLKDCYSKNIIKRACQTVLRIFAPLM